MVRGALILVIWALAPGVAGEPLAPEPLPPVAAPGPKAGSVDLRGTVHVATRGDRECDPSRWCGTRGRGLALEGLTLELIDPPKGLGLEYMCHTQDRGDTGWLPAGTLCGSRGEARRLEGVALRLVGPRASRYSVVYDCHIHQVGDQGWHRDGELCGTRGQARGLEALLVLIERRSPPPSAAEGAPPEEP